MIIIHVIYIYIYSHIILPVYMNIWSKSTKEYCFPPSNIKFWPRMKPPTQPLCYQGDMFEIRVIA